MMDRRRWIGYAMVAALLVMVPATVQARPITLAWDRNSESDVTGYIISYGTQSRNYTTSVNVGNVVLYTLDLPGSQYYFAVQAYTALGATSPPSNEAVFINGAPTITNPGPQSAITGTAVSLAIAASDPDGDSLRFGATNLPAGLVINTSSGMIGGTVAASAAGTYTTTVTVSDGALTTPAAFSWVVTAPSPGSRADARRASDFDGDAKSDITVFRASTGGWYTLKSNMNYAGSASYMWGLSTDLAVPGDYDGDGKTDPTVYRPSTGGWYILKSSTNYGSSIGVSWGLSTDLPVPGDYDGDGKTDPTIYRPSTGGWYSLQSSTNYGSSIGVLWGLSTDIPVPGDYDGDGKTDPAIYRPATGLWAILKSSTNYTTSIVISSSSIGVAVPGDYDGDGKIDPAVYSLTGGWSILKSSLNYSTSPVVFWGLPTDTPVPGDYDGDGKTDVGVFRPSTGGWYILKSSTNNSTSLGVLWGLSTDIPLNKRPW